MMLEMQVAANERSRRAVLADPVKHKATLHFPENARMRWLYYGNIASRGKRYRYCYSTGRNLAGYFLGWREVVNLKTGMGERDMISASKRRKTVSDQALQRHKAHKARLAKGKDSK